MVPRVFKFLDGEFIVLHLGFLHTKDYREVLLKPRYDDVEPGAYGVHVVGGDLDSSHGHLHDLSRPILARSMGGVLLKMDKGEQKHINIMDYLLSYKVNDERLLYFFKGVGKGVENPRCAKIV